MKKIVDFTYQLKRGFIISWKANSKLFFIKFIFEVVIVFLAPISTMVLRNMINAIILKDVACFYQLVCLLVVLQIITAAIHKINMYINVAHSEAVSHYIKNEIINKIISLDISYFDNPKFYDILQNVNRDSKALQSLTRVITSMMKGVVQAVLCGVILGNVYFALPVIFFIVNIPSVIIDRNLTRKQYDWQRKRTNNERKLNYLDRILEGKEYSKDIRILGSKDYFFQKYDDLWKNWISEKRKIDLIKITLSFSSGILPILSEGVFLIFLFFNIFSGQMSIGDFTYYQSILAQYKSGISSLLMSYNSGLESLMILESYAQFQQLKPLISLDGTEKIANIDCIEFKNVWFKYPNTENWILKNISFKLSGNEKVALIGLNGAGKTTITKLLLHLYEPTKGTILINNIDIKNIEVNSLNRQFGVVFQDYNNYHLTLRESIAISNIEHIDNDNDIEKACGIVDIDVNDVEKFKYGLETMIGKNFDENGSVLSGGQWQKIAIARTYFGGGSFFVLDEPNASLDIYSEKRIFSAFYKLCDNKGCMLVTHRFSSLNFVNRIIVLNNGEIEAIGNHEELICKSITYKELYEKGYDHV